MVIDPSRLKEISEKQQAKIEVYGRGIIRITADKTTALQTLENFDDLHSSVIPHVFKARVFGVNKRRNHSIEEDFAVVAHLTKTSFQSNKDGVRITGATFRSAS